MGRCRKVQCFIEKSEDLLMIRNKIQLNIISFGSGRREAGVQNCFTRQKLYQTKSLPCVRLKRLSRFVSLQNLKGGGNSKFYE